MMKRFILILLLASQLANAQQPQVYIEPEQYYKQGYDLFAKEKYGAAILEFDKAIQQKNVSRSTQINAQYYSAVCSAELFNKDAEVKLRNFIEEYPAENKTKLAAFQLAKVYYKQRQWKRSVEWFEKSDVTLLTPDEITEFYFKSGYAYFMRGDLTKASKNLHEIINVY